jgi:hypothetical protein
MNPWKTQCVAQQVTTSDGSYFERRPFVKKAHNPHKFDLPMKVPLTYRKRFELEYASHFIPYLELLEKEISREKVIESLHKLALHEAEEYAEYVVKTKGKNDLSVFKEDYSPTTPGMSDILTIEVLEDTEEAYGIKITECLWAEVFRNAGVADYGYAAVCYGDVPFARCINPKIDLDLEGTIMEGKPFCRLRYFIKP